MSSINLKDTSTAINFYDNRYRDGYMEEWDEIKKNKVREVIQLLNLPSKGKALDFGCGNGVFTNILKEELPQWEVYGVEISPTAIHNAKQKFPACNFFGLEEVEHHLASFDFLFSHHVIEHVQNLDETFQIINSYLKAKAFQLHILPCGNEGSYEHTICKLVANGIELEKENRFFFEEPGHLRRLSTTQFEEQERKIGFILKKAFYANQKFGAINWIANSSPRFVRKLTDFTKAKDPASANELIQLRKYLMPLTYIQFPYSKYWLIKSKWHKTIMDYLKLFILFIPAMIVKPVYNKYAGLATKEWREKKMEMNGSEMFLFFER